jgi:hypothetical protein
MQHTPPVASTAPTVAIGVWPGGWSSDSLALDDVLAYQRDLWERTILFWDTLRQRADNMIAHERAGKKVRAAGQLCAAKDHALQRQVS